MISLYKPFGGALILAVGVWIAVRTARYERRRLTTLDAWIELILYIRTQIDCYLTPLDNILAAAPHRLTDRLGRGEKDLNALLSRSRPDLDDRAYEQIEMLLCELGTSYREEQVKLCDYRLALLRDLRGGLAAELPARQKRGVTLSLSAAVGLAILLW